MRHLFPKEMPQPPPQILSLLRKKKILETEYINPSSLWLPLTDHHSSGSDGGGGNQREVNWWKKSVSN
jgi:hypothetical protein